MERRAIKTLVGKSGAWLAVEGKGPGKEARRPPDSWQVYWSQRQEILAKAQMWSRPPITYSHST